MEQGTHEWLEMRKRCVTATDAAIIMGLNPYGMTPQKLWQQKKGYLAPTQINAAMQRGSYLEPQALKWAERNLGWLLCPKVTFHKHIPWLMASLDGITISEDAIVEIKCGEKSHELARHGVIPEYYLAQMQHQMLVTGLNEVTYISFDGADGITIKVKRNNEFIEMLLEKATEFYGYLCSNSPPPADEGDHVRVDADPQLINLINLWSQSAESLKVLDQQEKALKARICDYGDDGSIEFIGIDSKPLVRLTRICREGSVDWKKLCDDRGIMEHDIAPYRKEQIGYYKLTKCK